MVIIHNLKSTALFSLCSFGEESSNKAVFLYQKINTTIQYVYSHISLLNDAYNMFMHGTVNGRGMNSKALSSMAGAKLGKF